MGSIFFVIRLVFGMFVLILFIPTYPIMIALVIILWTIWGVIWFPFLLIYNFIVSAFENSTRRLDKFWEYCGNYIQGMLKNISGITHLFGVIFVFIKHGNG